MVSGRGRVFGPALNEDEQRCAAASIATGNYYVAVTSSSVTRMQSPVLVNNLP